MRIVILGAGPAGLYLAYLIKRRQPDADVTIIEQNSTDATFGFGVVFSDRALEFLREDDQESYAAIVPHMESILWCGVVTKRSSAPLRIFSPIVSRGLALPSVSRP